MSDPYVRWFTSDFLNGVADLEDFEIGIYTVILALMADKGAPIDDDARWIARRCGSTTRRTNATIAKLESLGKIQRRNGLLGNAKMMREIQERSGKSNRSRKAANARWDQWRAENKPQLPFESGDKPVESPGTKSGTTTPADKKPEKNARKSREKRREKIEKNSPVNSQKSQETANSAMQTHVDSRARAEPEPESLQSTEQNTFAARANLSDRSVDSNPDVVDLFETVSAAAGYVPRGAKGYAESVELICGWREAGIDFELTVLPTIQRIVAESSDPTSSLKRFDRAIRHQHARDDALASTGKSPPRPQAKPVLKFEDEDPEHSELRIALLEALGQPAYCSLFNERRLETITDAAPGRRPLRTTKRGVWIPHLDELLHIIRPVVEKHGWTDIW